MVNVVDITEEAKKKKEKVKKGEGLAKIVFGKPFVVEGYSPDPTILIGEKVKKVNRYFLQVRLSYDPICFDLNRKKYFNKTEKLAEMHKAEFNKEVMIRTDYSSDVD